MSPFQAESLLTEFLLKQGLFAGDSPSEQLQLSQDAIQNAVQRAAFARQSCSLSVNQLKVPKPAALRTNVMSRKRDARLKGASPGLMNPSTRSRKNRRKTRTATAMPAIHNTFATFNDIQTIPGYCGGIPPGQSHLISIA